MLKTNPKQWLVFRYGLLIITFGYALSSWLKHQEVTCPFFVSLSLGFTILILNIFNPVLLKWIFKQWMRVTSIIGQLFTTILLTIIYFLIFMPMRVFLLISQKDFMGKNAYRQKKSYWIKYQPLGDHTQQF